MKQYERRHVDLFDRTLLVWRPTWARIFGNDEDGIDGAGTIDPNNHFADETKNWPLWLRILVWSAWRNPTGNARFIKPLGFIIDPKRVKWIGNSTNPREPGKFLWCFTTHGLYSGLQIRVGKWRPRIGWAVEGRDAEGVTDYRAKGCGFKFQPFNKD